MDKINLLPDGNSIVVGHGDAWVCRECDELNHSVANIFCEGCGHNRAYTEAKHDHGKPRFDLIDPVFEEDLAKVMSFGAEKYSDNTWQTVPDGLQRYHGAIRRHLNAIQKGELIDPDSGLPHIAHVSANAMFISYLLRDKDEDKHCTREETVERG